MTDLEHLPPIGVEAPHYTYRENVTAAPMVMRSIPVLPEFATEVVSRSLSQVLREGTELAHKELELRLGLPGSIRPLSHYRACLLRFYDLYEPLETDFQRFPEWASIGLDVAGCSHSGSPPIYRR